MRPVSGSYSFPAMWDQHQTNKLQPIQSHRKRLWFHYFTWPRKSNGTALTLDCCQGARIEGGGDWAHPKRSGL